MRLSWSEIRSRARAFSLEWINAHYEKGETHSFYNDFFAIFGVKRRQVASYEQRVKLLDNRTGFIDLFWPGVLLVEQKSAGLDLGNARGQALNYFDALKDDQQPRYILTCDFQRFRLLDLDTGLETPFTLPELYKHVEAFAFILGRQRTFGTQAAVNIKAAELLGRLHDALEESDYNGHDLERLLVRLLFCLFADDTGIFEPKDIFLSLVEEDTRDDGSDVGRVITELFDILDTPEGSRQRMMRPELLEFPYINGGLFAGHVRTPVFDKRMRAMLLDACRFDWSKVSPAIFGSLFQSVMQAKERREKGAHYTTEANIFKVIRPLFLDRLESELASIKARQTGRKDRLIAFQQRLSTLRFFDPACGCGNFLVIAYRELRRLELETIEALRAPTAYMDDRSVRQTELDTALLSLVTVEQFFGIEFEEFPARIAEVALWMADHLANNELSIALGQSYARIPLISRPHILHADALETNWAELLPPDRCSFIMGNPPFVGKKEQSDVQKAQVRSLFPKVKGAGDLDYVSCWFLKAAEYVQFNPRVEVGFVATNSITQGEQVAPLWSMLTTKLGLRIQFAHRTFEWSSEARGTAHVHVVIIGLTKGDQRERKVIFDYAHPKAEPTEVIAANINPYLIDYRDVFVRKSKTPLSPRPLIQKGNEATDFGFLTVEASARAALLAAPGFRAEWLRPFHGGDEFINRQDRFCLWLRNADPRAVSECDILVERLKAVTKKRKKSTKANTKRLADFPTLFGEYRQPASTYILIPKVSSQKREYVPLGFVDQSVVVSGSAQFIETDSRFVFSVVTSAIHMAWMRTVGGRTKSDYQYTNGLVYNTFPWPTASEAQMKAIADIGEEVLSAREEWPLSSLSILYDLNTMPPRLREAHQRLDRAVDKLYQRTPFSTDRERVEHLFHLYEKLTQPLTATATAKAPRKRRSAA